MDITHDDILPVCTGSTGFTTREAAERRAEEIHGWLKEHPDFRGAEDC